MIIFFTLLILFLIILASVLFFLIFTIFTGAPYVGTSKERVEDMVRISKIKKGQNTLDLGSGDGRIVIAMARKGAIAEGFEINPFYVLLSKIKIHTSGVSKNATIHWKNFWSEDVSKYDVITIYGVSYIMDNLEKKLKKEMKKDARVISTSYSFKNWKPRFKKDFIFVYKK